MEGPGCPEGAVMGGVREPDLERAPPDPSTAGEKPQGQGGGFIHPVCDTDRETGTPLYGEDRVIREGLVDSPRPRVSDIVRNLEETGYLKVPGPPGPSLGAIDGSGTKGQRWERDRGESRASGGLHQDTERGEDAESGGEMLEGRESPGRREALKEGSGTEQQSLIPRAGPEGSTQTSPGEKESRRRTLLPPTGKKEE
ncbi:hypothetical protein NDU88_004965 [Pleurodeles waltl]|uniref:Uncharacterized protein n=1 Tax=Pleurodeles waltl TaxID=8319 RepID=A0AAV7V2Y5_PLEWA|nr:hypothetical protein NDU88_004965 [Pleurodeles waltl]